MDGGQECWESQGVVMELEIIWWFVPSFVRFHEKVINSHRSSCILIFFKNRIGTRTQVSVSMSRVICLGSTLRLSSCIGTILSLLLDLSVRWQHCTMHRSILLNLHWCCHQDNTNNLAQIPPELSSTKQSDYRKIFIFMFIYTHLSYLRWLHGYACHRD